jgi:putative tricarboxylic transport membrane protein
MLDATGIDRPQSQRRPSNQIMDLDTMVAGLFVIFAGIMVFQSVGIGLGTFHEPGPGFMPALSTATLGTLSLVYMISRILSRTSERTFEFKLGTNWLEAFYIMFITFIYVVIALDKLGYLISTALWLVVIFRIAGVRPWIRNVLFSLITVMTSYLILVKVAHCILPGGIFSF